MGTNTVQTSRVEKLVHASVILNEVADEVIQEWRNGDASTEQVAAITSIIDQLEKLAI